MSRNEARPARFDSASAMVSATARFLRGEDFPVLGLARGEWLRPLLVALNQLPAGARNWIYRTGSGHEGQDPEVVARADSARLARGVVEQYGPGPYPAAIIGSTPGSTAHLAAALGAPLLPQTLLVPVRRRGVDLDDPQADIEATRGAAERLLAANPDLALHQMFDPCQDRLTLARFGYFRIKRLALGPVYEEFLLRRLRPGATIFVACSEHRWPTTTVGERHYFQFGGIGGLSPEEYVKGSERVARFLAEQGSPVRQWSAPPTDTDRPEAEWGLDPELLDDVRRFADRHGFRLKVLRFGAADGLSPAVAELYRSWYRSRGQTDDHLFAESFVLLDPLRVLRARAVPYWMTFNSDNAADHLERYVERAGPFGRIDITLIANGTTSPGLAPLERWRQILGQATEHGSLAGIDTARYPSDLASFVRYRDPLRRQERPGSIPQPLAPAEVAEILAGLPEAFAVGVE